MNDGTLIMPIAGRSSRFPGTRPKWMLTAPTGPLMLELSLKSVPDWRNRRVVIGALREHLQDLGGEGAIRRAMGSHPEIVIFDEVTSGPASTVAEIIRRADITGPIFVKDCDSWFEAPDHLFDDVVCIADIHGAPNIRNIPSKSFVKLNENSIITGIYEKIVCSNYISVGGYGFRSAAAFVETYLRIQSDRSFGEPFVSHVVFELIKQGEAFRGVRVAEYEDVGTLDAWREFRSRFKTYIVDLDGVVFKNAGAYIPPLWSHPDIGIQENIETIKRLQSAGGQIIFVTARPEEYRVKTEEFLIFFGLKWHSIIFGLNHAQRVLVNDFAPSNPFPSAVAISLPRNSAALDEYVK